MKAKTISALLSAFLVSATVFGCAKTQTEELAVSSDETAKDPVSADEAIPELDENEKAPLSADTVIAVLDEIENYAPGVLGSSLKVCHAAFAFIDFSQEFDTDDTEIFENTVSEYIAKYTEEEFLLFREKVSDMEEVAQTLFTDGLEALLPRLDDAGNPQKYSEYDEEKYNTLMDIFKNVLNKIK